MVDNLKILAISLRLFKVHFILSSVGWYQGVSFTHTNRATSRAGTATSGCDWYSADKPYPPKKNSANYHFIHYFGEELIEINWMGWSK